MSDLTTPCNVDPSVLTPVQEKAIALLYDDAKEIVSTIAEAATNSLFVTVSKIIGEVIKLVEAVSIMQITLVGADKKVVVIEVIRKILMDAISDEELRMKILIVFNEIADATIDVMIVVSNGLKAVKKLEEEIIKDVKTVCCPSLTKN